MTDPYTIRAIDPRDLPAMLELLPQLADFQIPERRNPLDLWQSDAQLLREVVAGKSETSFADVIVDAADVAQGLILVTLREELMSHAPSAHLEAIVVSPKVRGHGLGRRLLQHAEHACMLRGARSLSLHVFSNNLRARGLYDLAGYDSELIRAIKWFD
ncbi:MAG: GNAT family N-acetyltransferase [bacterium]